MYAKYGKRALDIAGATLLVAVLVLPMIVVSLWIRFDSHGPALFRQKRYGQNKNPFTVYKFRSMATHAPNDRATNDFHDSHAYITGFGRILRKLSIDELPQLYNVLRGEMSLVGPRPVVMSEKRIIKLRDNYGANAVKPGITGWAQANGRDELDDVAKAEMDGHYVDNFGFSMDMRCILKTVLVILTAAGHAEGHQQAAKNDDKVTAGE